MHPTHRVDPGPGVTTRLIALFVLISLTVGGVRAEGSSGDDNTGLADTSWPMYRGDPGHTGQSNHNLDFMDIGVKWVYQGGSKSSPCIGEDGAVYFIATRGDGNYLTALNPDGTLRWDLYIGGRQSSPSFLSSPAIDAGGNVYVGTVNSLESQVISVSGSGEENWRYRVNEWVISSPALGDDGTIYIASRDGVLHSLNANGTMRWNFTAQERIMSSPAIGADGSVYIASYDRNLYAFEPDGTEKWRASLSTYTSSSPSIGLDGSIYIKTYSGTSNGSALHSVSPDGELNWVTHGAYDSTPAIGIGGDIYVASREPVICADGTIITGKNKYICALSPDGELIWQMTIESPISSSFSMGPDGTVYVCTFDGLYALGVGGEKTEGRVYQVNENIPYENIPYWEHPGDIPVILTYDTEGTLLWEFTPIGEGEPDFEDCSDDGFIPGFGLPGLITAMAVILASFISVGRQRKRERK